MLDQINRRSVRLGPTHRTVCRHGLLVLPAVLLALVPRLACPCQLPAYAALLGWLGLTTFEQTVYLFPLTAAFLTLAVGGLAVGAHRRHGLRPFLAGLLAAAMLLISKFVLAWPFAVHAAVLLLLAASLWNAWPTRKKLCFAPDGSVSIRGRR